MFRDSVTLATDEVNLRDEYNHLRAAAHDARHRLQASTEKSGVRVLAVCPGPIATGFFANMNPLLQPKQMDQPPAIVREILRAFAMRKTVVTPGKLSVRLGTLGARLLPRNVILRLAAGTVQQLNRKSMETDDRPRNH